MLPLFISLLTTPAIAAEPADVPTTETAEVSTASVLQAYGVCHRARRELDLSAGIDCPNRGDFWAAAGWSALAGTVIWVPAIPIAAFGSPEYGGVYGVGAVIGAPFLMGAVAAKTLSLRSEISGKRAFTGAMVGYGVYLLAAVPTSLVILFSTYGSGAFGAVVGLGLVAAAAPLAITLGAKNGGIRGLQRANIKVSVLPMIGKGGNGLRVAAVW